MSEFYVLDKDHNVVPARNVYEWAKFFESKERIVAQDKIGDYFVSTVFLGLDHGVFERPLVFETMIFKHKTALHDEYYQDRYFTWDEALAGHAKAVESVR